MREIWTLLEPRFGYIRVDSYQPIRLLDGPLLQRFLIVLEESLFLYHPPRRYCRSQGRDIIWELQVWHSKCLLADMH